MIEEVRFDWGRTAWCLRATLKSPNWESMGFFAQSM